MGFPVSRIDYVDEAKSNRTKCCNCGRQIMKLEPRSIRVFGTFRFKKLKYVCYKCVKEDLLTLNQRERLKEIMERNKVIIAVNNLNTASGV